MTIPIKDLKKDEPYAYIRLSFDELGEAKKWSKERRANIWKIPKMKTQLNRVKDFLKANGLKPLKPANTFGEVASGGEPTREVWQRLIQNVVPTLKKPSFVIFTDMSRWSRNMRYGMAESIPLYINDIPMVSADDNLVIGTKLRPDADGDLLFGVKTVVSNAELENIRRRTRSGMKSISNTGVYTSGGLDLFPLSKQDPYDWVLENMADGATKEKGGLGWTVYGNRLKDNVEGVKTTNLARNIHTRLAQLKSEMTDLEFSRWNAFRKRIRTMEKKLGENDWGVRAVRYRSNGFISAPLDERYAREPTDSDIQLWFDNPEDNLSYKDTKQWTSEVKKKKLY